MKFGKVDRPGKIDFSIPPDHPDSRRVLSGSGEGGLEIRIGCAKWNKADLKGFYPKGTKDELAYYSQHFNCIEMNATFHRNHPAEQFRKWRAAATDGFKFFPKMTQSVTHYRRLNDTAAIVDEFVEKISLLEEKLEASFVQMHNNFAPKDFEKVQRFVESWQYDVPLALELRHTEWFNDTAVSGELYDLLESSNVTNVLVDTAGRRDLMHMRLTTPTAFIRWVGANHRSDKKRLDEWVERIAEWKECGLKKLYFFVHQNLETESPLLAAHFIKKLNKRLGSNIKVPKTLKADRK